MREVPSASLGMKIGMNCCLCTGMKYPKLAVPWWITRAKDQEDIGRLWDAQCDRAAQGLIQRRCAAVGAASPPA